MRESCKECKIEINGVAATNICAIISGSQKRFIHNALICYNKYSNEIRKFDLDEKTKDMYNEALEVTKYKLWNILQLQIFI